MNIKATIALGGIVLLTATGCVMRAPAPEPAPIVESSEITPAPDAQTAEPVATQEPAPVPAAPAEPELSLAQQNAIESAEGYLSFMNFSRSGLIDQLVFEEYTEEEATFAVDSLNVDWNAQAAGDAQGYMDLMSMSRGELLDQLLFEGYTPEQAEFGVTAVGY